MEKPLKGEHFPSFPPTRQPTYPLLSLPRTWGTVYYGIYGVGGLLGACAVWRMFGLMPE